jgi:3'(2'), 5'-bisphosphate nucleotidase
MKIDIITKIATEAGSIIMDIYNNSDFNVEMKSDNSPLTVADKRANAYICSELKRLYPSIPIISEEIKNIDYSQRLNWDECFIVDPLDGTKEFIKKSDEFTVNIALVRKGVPSMGVVYAPALGLLYYTDGNNAFRESDNKVEKLPLNTINRPYTVVASKSHLNVETEEFVNNLKKDHPNLESKSIGSSLKFCLIAQGDADIYPRLGPTMEWDTAAADAICRASGAKVLIHELNTPLLYNKENLLNPFFICTR